MIRGDTKNFNFKVKRGTEYVDGSIYTEVEVQFNKQNNYYAIKKLLSNGEVSWETDHFTCPLSQEDTFKLMEGDNDVQVRLYINEDCKGTIIKRINVGEVLSNDVLSDEEQ